MSLAIMMIDLFGERVAFHHRPESHADRGVFRQVFAQQDYGITHWVQGERLKSFSQSLSKPGLIIDAGANIGASALYFLNYFRNSFVFAIEPDAENFQLLELNTSNYTNRKCFLGGIAERDGNMFLVDPGMGDWGYRIAPVGEKSVRTISVPSVLNDADCADTIPLLIKIDIEGGEQFLFASNTDWLGLFPLIIIELHDWMLPWSGNSRNFFRSIAEYEFDVVHRGENLFLFNRSILS